MTPIDEKMFLVGQDNGVYYFDGAAEDNFVDAPQSTVVVSRATTHYTHMDEPGTIKRFISIDMAKQGPVTISSNWTPWGEQPIADWGPALIDATIGTPRIPFVGSGTAVSLDIQCNATEGFELQMLDLKYIPCGRR